MPIKSIAEFNLTFLQILDEDGNCDEKLKPSLSDKQLLEMYKAAIRVKAFDQKALKLQRQGRLLTYAAVNGQEACQIGSAFALSKDDWMFPAFRENGVYIALGFPMYMLYQYWDGDERGMRIPDNMNLFTVAIPVASQILHATGAAMASKIKGEKNAAIVYFGDGATSKGDFHEALNFAGTFKAPVVYLCQNNQWAISMPVKRQTAAETIAQKGIAYGINYIRVDGNDFFAVYKATKDALDSAKKGNGPTLIECLTYRMGDHTTADDALKYRDQKEAEEWKKRDPVERFKKYLLKKKILTEPSILEIQQAAETEVNEAIAKREALAPQAPEEIFNYTYAELTPELKAQKEELKEYITKQGDDKHGEA
ncbi:pyruvate dehydrogenase (acetyl-transferring) E1 component subunit alpha [Candidatus Woesearchaeota archaeon]|nr:pyruvate dehydrogenase (acetyl-transferring) E1 component subunit alpha [Candidatus Woesearchaeota archaeon]